MSCRTKSSQKLFTFEENKSKLTLENVEQVESTKIVVDGCEINDDSIRCDYMLLAKEKEFYIELKGQDLLHAVAQLKATIKRLSPNFKSKNKKSYVICTRSPLSSTQIQNLKFDLIKNFNSDLQIKSSPYKDKY
jgi:hypothetical protein